MAGLAGARGEAGRAEAREAGSWKREAGSREAGSGKLEAGSGSSPPPFVDQVRDQSRPSGLVIGAEPGAVVAVEVLVEEQQVAPVRILLELLGAAVDPPPAVRVRA